MRKFTRIAMRLLLMVDSVVSKLINRLAIPYDGGVHVKHRLMRYHEFFVNRVASGERVLDIGCGYGAVAYSLAARAGALVTGIDLNEANVAKARGNSSILTSRSFMAMPGRICRLVRGMSLCFPIFSSISSGGSSF